MPDVVVRLEIPGYDVPVYLKEGYLEEKPHTLCEAFLLPDLDSNQDKQNQNLLYYHYTIGQSVMKVPEAKLGNKIFIANAARIRNH